MYNQYFGLEERPFSIAPDPRFLFMSGRHRDALAHLLYGVGEGGGFVMLTGEVGTGKTTICRCLLEQLPKNIRLAYILNPKLNAVELMATMCDELGIRYDKGESSLKTFTDLLSQRLLANHEQGLNTVLMIDEAQNLSVEVLEQIRLLTNLETNQKKLLQIILIGQPELQELLARRELRQLAQRITARFHLKPLNVKETTAYINHRLRIGGNQRPIFSRSNISDIHKASQGIPRIINVICDRALLGAYAKNQHKVDKVTLRKAINEVVGFDERTGETSPLGRALNPNYVTWVLGSLLVVCLLAIAYLAIDRFTADQEEPVEVAVNESADQSAVSSTISAEPPSLSGTALVEEMLGNQTWDRKGVTSQENLLALWGVDFNSLRDGSGCVFARRYGLQCTEGFADWRQLEQMNRPVNVKFVAGELGPFWGTLKAIDGEQLTLQFGDREVVLPMTKASSLWTGEYQLFWRPPPGYEGPMTVGSRGPTVRWLSGQLATLNGGQPGGGVFNDSLREKIRRFQRDNQLIPDGIAGVNTIIALNSATLAEVPRLVRDNT